MTNNVENSTRNDVAIVPTSCLHNCGGRCLLKAHVKDGKIIRIETDGGEQPQLRACARGRAYRQRVYAPDRLLYPLRRLGERGEGRFERISWDEALDVVASNLRRVKADYGNAAILFIGGSGSTGFVHGVRPVKHLLEQFGGFTGTWGIPSCEGTMFASLATYGTFFTGNSEDDLLHSGGSTGTRQFLSGSSQGERDWNHRRRPSLH
jgi:anaerobic dimethyl sulfoxide reductase subunit A